MDITHPPFFSLKNFFRAFSFSTASLLRKRYTFHFCSASRYWGDGGGVRGLIEISLGGEGGGRKRGGAEMQRDAEFKGKMGTCGKWLDEVSIRGSKRKLDLPFRGGEGK